MSNSIYGLSEKAIQLCEERATYLTNNLANAATPHYKARDIDFYKTMQALDNNTAMTVTNPNHMNVNGDAGKENAELLYRIPMQRSLDGNTVDNEIERKNFLENSLRYQVNLTFIQNRTAQISKALKGD